MTFDLEEKPGVWFDMEGGGRVQLRTLSPADWRRIRKATVKQAPFAQPIEGTYRVFTHEVIDTDLQNELINDSVIVAWENLLDKNGKPIPCTTENKVVLMLLRDGTFRDFVNDRLASLQKAEAQHAEVVSKNL